MVKGVRDIVWIVLDFVVFQVVVVYKVQVDTQIMSM
jgi:hypothetical protein